MTRTQNAIELTFAHPWMTVSDAELLLQDAYNRFHPHKKYGGNILHTLLKIEFSIFLRSTEECLQEKLNKIKEG